MKNIVKVAGLGVVGVALSAGAASADTSVYNRYETTHTFNGYTSTDVSGHINTQTNTTINSTSIKLEAIADLGDVNRTSISFKGKDNFSAHASSSNNAPTDPISTVYYTEINEMTTVSETQNLDIVTFSENNFKSTSFTHSVGNTF